MRHNFVSLVFKKLVSRHIFISKCDTISKASICNYVARNNFIYLGIFLKSATQLQPVTHTLVQSDCLRGGYQIWRRIWFWFKRRHFKAEWVKAPNYFINDFPSPGSHCSQIPVLNIQFSPTSRLFKGELSNFPCWPKIIEYSLLDTLVSIIFQSEV